MAGRKQADESRHQQRDWGDINHSDWHANDAALRQWQRDPNVAAALYSWYNTDKGRIMIHTPVGQKTTVLLPGEW